MNINKKFDNIEEIEKLLRISEELIPLRKFSNFIFLIVIAFVALYCPAIGLMLAILLVSIIQMCQRKQLSQDINNIQNNYENILDDISKNQLPTKANFINDLKEILIKYEKN